MQKGGSAKISWSIRCEYCGFKPHRVLMSLPHGEAGRHRHRQRADFSVEGWVCYNFLFVNEPKQARKYLISGAVQGVGYRYFTQRAAAKMKVGGYVKNLRDGRVEVFVIGTPQQHRELRTLLERGPRFSSVTEVREEAPHTIRSTKLNS